MEKNIKNDEFTNVDFIALCFIFFSFLFIGGFTILIYYTFCDFNYYCFLLFLCFCCVLFGFIILSFINIIKTLITAHNDHINYVKKIELENINLKHLINKQNSIYTYCDLFSDLFIDELNKKDKKK